MNLKECYEAFNGDYDGVLGRMRSEALVRKFVLKFADDPNFNALQIALDGRNREDAFRAAHTIKGVCQNLGFTELQKSSELLTSVLRVNLTDDCFAMMNQVAEDYRKIIKAVEELRNSAE